MSSAALPPGYSPPNTVITDTDHGGWVTIANGLMLCLVLFFLAVRLYVRAAISPPFRWNDTAVCLGTAVSLIQSAIVFLQVFKGFGKSAELISREDLVQVQKLAYTSDILYLIVLSLSKCSVCLLLIVLTPSNSHIRFSKTVLALTALWTVISVSISGLRCDLSQPWIQYDIQCSGLLPRAIFITTMNSLIETFIFIGAVLLVVKLRMATEKKVIVVIVFASRLPLIALTGLRLHYLQISWLSTNPTIIGVPATLFTQIELGWSLISATIPSLNHFMRAVSTRYGAMDSDTIIGGSHISGQTKRATIGTIPTPGGSHDLQSYVSKKSQILLGSRPLTKSLISTDSKSRRRSRHKSRQPISFASTSSKNHDTGPPQPHAPIIYRGDHASNVAQISSDGRVERHSTDGDSNDSTRMIIKKEVQWAVETDKETTSTTHTVIQAEKAESDDQITRAG